MDNTVDNTCDLVFREMERLSSECRRLAELNQVGGTRHRGVEARLDEMQRLLVRMF